MVVVCTCAGKLILMKLMTEVVLEIVGTGEYSACCCASSHSGGEKP